MALETVKVTVVDDSLVPQPIDGVVVRVFDETGATFITQGITGLVTQGVVEFTLDGDDPPIQYSLRFYKALVSITSPQAITVYSPASGSPTGTNNFEISGSVFVEPEAVDEFACRASGFVYDGACRPRKGIDMHFIPQFDQLKVDRRGVLGERVHVRTDRDGFISVDLWRGGCYHVTLESHENITRAIQVPDRASVPIMDLLFPIVRVVTYTPSGPYSMSVGDTLELSVSVLATNFQTLEGAAPEDVVYEVEDTSIASVTVSSTGLVITANAPGTTNLTASRRDESIIYVPDPGITGSPIGITVS